MENPQTEFSNLRYSQDKTRAWIFMSGLQTTPVLWVISQYAVAAGQEKRALTVTSIHGKGHSTAETVNWALPGERQSPPHKYRLAARDEYHTRQQTPWEARSFHCSSVQKCQRCCCQQEDTESRVKTYTMDTFCCRAGNNSSQQLLFKSPSTV